MVQAGSFFAELKRRHVYRVAIVYVIASWVLLQLAAILFPMFGAPDWVLKVFFAVLVFGFPIALILAWAFEMTPEGIRRTEPADSPDARPAEDTSRVGRQLNRIALVVMALVIVLLLADRFALRPRVDPRTPAAREASIAVLPLANDSGDKDQQYFSDGLSENLIIALSQLKGLTVIGRNSAFQFRDSREDSKAIGAKLGVAHLLEGSVQRAGDMVRISAELINAVNGHTLWSQRYDRPYRELFALQDEITREVAGALKAQLLPATVDAPARSDRPPSGNLDAYNAFLQGRFHGTHPDEESQRKAIAYLTHATELDDRYALAWAERSRILTGVAGRFLSGDEAQQNYAQARAAAATALRLEPDLGAAHEAVGYLHITADFDWAGAETEYRRALQLAPHEESAMFNLGLQRATLGHIEEAIELTRQALAADPLNAYWQNWLSVYLTPLGRLDEAERAVRKAIELQPGGTTYYQQLAVIAILRGDAAAAVAAAREEPPGEWADDAVALALQIGSDRAAADAALKAMEEKNADAMPYQIAQIYGLRNDAGQTFAWLDRAWTARDAGIGYLLIDPFILRFRDDPRFATFCTKIGLPTATTATVTAIRR
jgi:TolB-like protein/Flp pilus assembly protein TadD